MRNEEVPSGNSSFRILHSQLSQMHTLALDIGNTAVKAGCFAGSTLHETAAGLSAAQVHELIRRWQPQHLIVASVAGEAALGLEELRPLVPGLLLVFQPGTTAIPLHNAYATPHTLGADRLAAAVGAASLRPGEDTLIIDAGTALKCDLVMADGSYHGGSIAPGLSMRLRALHSFTGRLPLLELPAADATLPLTGDSTTGAMLSGVVNGTVAELTGFIAEYQRRFPQLGIVLTGGDAAFLAPRLPARIFVVPELVLLGLNRILAYNVEK
jgi:type III pantothenate kinase